MRLSQAVITLLVLAVALFAVPPVQAQCSQGGVPVCGPDCQWYNVLYDPYFNQTGCNAWVYGLQGAQKAPTGAQMCNGWQAGARFVGPTNGWSFISQSTTTQPPNQGDHFWLSYTFETNDPANDPNTRIAIEILTPNGYFATIDGPHGGARWCDTRQIDLGHHPEWVGRSIGFWIDGYVPSAGATISIASVALWQGL
jgi:hypothetical protein